MNRKSAAMLLIGILIGLIVANAFTSRDFEGDQWLLTIVGGVFGWAIVILLIRRRQEK